MWRFKFVIISNLTGPSCGRRRRPRRSQTSRPFPGESLRHVDVETPLHKRVNRSKRWLNRSHFELDLGVPSSIPWPYFRVFWVEQVLRSLAATAPIDRLAFCCCFVQTHLALSLSPLPHSGELHRVRAKAPQPVELFFGDMDDQNSNLLGWFDLN